MIRVFQLISALMLVLTVLLPLLYLFGTIGETVLKGLMLAVTVVWFGVTPCWMKRDEPTSGP